MFLLSANTIRPSQEQTIRRGWCLAGLLAVSVALTSGCGGAPPSDAASSGAAAPASEEGPEEAVAVRVAQVVREPLSSLYTTSATLRADKRATITARTSGVVRELLVEEGDRVDADQPLAVLENDEQQIDYDRAAAARDTKQREYDRAQELHDQGLMSDEEYETIRREAEETKQDAAMARLMLSRTTIRAPFAGTILERHLDAGATVTDGTAVFEIADLDPLYADVNVPERQISRLRPGQRVRLVADASSESADARIERIAPLVDPQTGTVKVTLAAAGTTSLRPGSFVRVLIVTDTHEQALVVPRSSLVAEGHRWHLFRVDPTGQSVEQLEVTRGFEDEDRVEILDVVGDAAPLTPADRVVVVGASALSDGMRVEIVETGGLEESEDDGRQASAIGVVDDTA